MALNLILAVTLASAGSIANAIGYVVQKKAHNKVNKENESIEKEEDKKTYVRDKLWIAGFAIYVIGSLLIAAALKFGAQSVVAPLGALTLVANTVLATKFLGEPFKNTDVYGIILVVIGSVLAVVFGPSSDAELDLQDIEDLAYEWVFLIFFLLLTGMAILDYIGVRYFERKNFRDQENMEIKHGKQYLMISYVALAAYFGSTNVLFMKAIVIILTTFETSYFAGWMLYFVILGIVVVNVLLEFFRQRALAYFGALFVVPIYQVLLIVGASMMGAVFFKEFDGMESYKLALFSIAIGITLCGVAVLAFNVGQYFDKVEHFIKVGLRFHKSKDDNDLPVLERTLSPDFPVWGGLYARLGQTFYLTRMPFHFNETFATMEHSMRELGSKMAKASDKVGDKVEHFGESIEHIAEEVKISVKVHARKMSSSINKDNLVKVMNLRKEHKSRSVTDTIKEVDENTNKSDESTNEHDNNDKIDDNDGLIDDIERKHDADDEIKYKDDDDVNNMSPTDDTNNASNGIGNSDGFVMSDEYGETVQTNSEITSEYRSTEATIDTDVTDQEKEK